MKKLIILIGLISCAFFAQAQVKGYTVEAIDYIILNGDTLRATTQTGVTDTTMATKLYVDAAAGAGIDSITFEDNYIKLYFGGSVLDSALTDIQIDSTWTSLNITDTLFLAGDTITGIKTQAGAGTQNDTITSKAYVDTLFASYTSTIESSIRKVSLPASGTVAGRIAGAIGGVDYPSGWSLSAGTNPVDIDITHSLNQRVASVTVFYVDGTTERQLFGGSAYSGIYTSDANNLTIESLATINSEISIYIVFK